MPRAATSCMRTFACTLALSSGFFFSLFFHPMQANAVATFCTPQYLGNYPREAEKDWTDDCQGITHDDTHWYINQRRTLFRIPVERNLWQDQKGAPGVTYRNLQDIPELDGYDHMGGSASYNYNGTWYILVPVDNGPGDALCAVFRADASLAVVGTATIPGQAEGAGWFAVGPDGYVYGSVSFPTELRRYSMNWSTIESGPVLTFVDTIPLTDENGDPYQLFHMQGGAIPPDNSVIFIANGLGDCLLSGGGTESDSFGMHAFDLATGQRITRSCQSGCAWRFEFNSCAWGYPDEEPEGITFWDLDNGAAPGIRGQLHAILLDNDLGISDVFLKHYRTTGTASSLGCPDDITVECSQHGGTPRTDDHLAGFFDVVALVGCDQGLAVTNDAPDFFPHGTTTVTFTASDGNGGTSECSAVVTVADSTAPVIACPDTAVVECTGECGAALNDSALVAAVGLTAVDICDAEVAITNDAPDCLPFGDTWVQFIATDDEGNADSCTVKVTVDDTVPPTIDVSLDHDTMWPPNHKLVTVCAEVTVSDACDETPSYTLFSVASDEPDNDKGDGNTTGDIQNAATGSADLCYDLRSESMGGGGGRTYTVIYSASDHSGNTAYDTVTVRVPHDQAANAHASSGFLADGSALDKSAGMFALIIPSTENLNAAALDASRIYLGNTRAVARPVEIRKRDANRDGRLDLGVFFDRKIVEVLLRDDGQEMSGALDRKGRISDGSVGLHFVSPEGIDYLVRNVFALGEPLSMPGARTDDLPAQLNQGVQTAPRATGLVSIHPNPFNPQTTVDFALSAPGRVQILIYDARGSLVRQLVDRPGDAGEGSAVWNGTDDGGRPVASGIYFVRMVAGNFRDTQKIVLLK
jgi:FlgD Ig-like domain/HYR domain